MSERDLQSLLSIDIDAEIRKLALHRYPSPVEWISELLRVAVRYGARELRLHVAKKHAKLHALGAHLPRDCVADLRTVIDPSQRPELRHEALQRCEQGGDLALLPMPVRRWRLISSAGMLQQSSASQPSFEARAPHSTVNADGFFLEIQWSERTFNPKAIETLRKACAYSPIPMLINGKRASAENNAGETLLRLPLRGAGLCGEIAVPQSDRPCRMVLVCQGVVCWELYGTSAEGWTFDAVLHDHEARHAQELRREVCERTVGHACLQLFEALLHTFPELTGEKKRWAKLLIYRRVAASKDASTVSHLRLFETVSGGGLSPDELVRIAREGPVWAVGELSEARARTLPSGVLVLDASDREFLNENYGIRVSEPPTTRGPGLLQRASRWLQGRVIASCVSLGRALMSLGSGTLAEGQLMGGGTSLAAGGAQRARERSFCVARHVPGAIAAYLCSHGRAGSFAHHPTEGRCDFESQNTTKSTLGCDGAALCTRYHNSLCHYVDAL